MHVQEKATLEFIQVYYSEFDELSHDHFHDSVLQYVDDPYSDALCNAVNRGFVDVDCKPCEHKPSVEICKFAESEKIDLIVMGSRGLSEIKELLIGSVSSEVLHHAPCPVTIIR